MKKKYYPPIFMVNVIVIEESLCNSSSTITIGDIDSDYLQEWDELADDNRNIQW